MNERVATLPVLSTLSALVVLASMSAATPAAAAVDPVSPGLVEPAGPSPGPWLVRVDGSLVAMRDSWLGIPAPELGLTVGRDLLDGFSVEATGSAREPGDAQRHSWSAAVALRWIALANATGRHALTVAAGPFVEIENVVHGTLPFARGELAYVYRAPIGLTVLAGGGLNMALADSPYVTPPSPCADNSGDSGGWCFDLGPDAQEIHTGDMVAHLRLAVGWQL